MAEANVKYMIIGNLDTALARYPKNEAFYLNIDSVSAVADNKTVAGRRNNRRVEIVIYYLSPQ